MLAKMEKCISVSSLIHRHPLYTSPISIPDTNPDLLPLFRILDTVLRIQTRTKISGVYLDVKSFPALPPHLVLQGGDGPANKLGNEFATDLQQQLGNEFATDLQWQ